MDLTPYVEQLRQDLTAATSTADEQTRRTAALLAASLQPAARLALMNALSDLAAEVTAALDDDVVDVRLSGRDVQVVVTRATPEPPPAASTPPPPPPPPPLDGGDISRITLRLFDELKSKAEKAASTQGVSLNSWVAQAVQGALHGHPGQPGKPGGDGAESGDRSDAGAQQSRPEPESRTRLRGWVQG